MKKALIFCAALFIVFAPLSLSVASDALTEAAPQEPEAQGSTTYKASSSAVELSHPSCVVGPKKIITDEGKGLWVEHGVDTEGCAAIHEPDANDGLDRITP